MFSLLSLHLKYLHIGCAHSGYSYLLMLLICPRNEAPMRSGEVYTKPAELPAGSSPSLHSPIHLPSRFLYKALNCLSNSWAFPHSLTGVLASVPVLYSLALKTHFLFNTIITTETAKALWLSTLMDIGQLSPRGSAKILSGHSWTPVPSLLHPLTLRLCFHLLLAPTHCLLANSAHFQTTNSMTSRQ